MATIKTDDKHYKNIAQAIRDKTGGNAQYKPGEMADGVGEAYDAGYAKGQAEGGGGSYDEGYEAGQKAEYDRFWDAFQNYGKQNNYDGCFKSVYWTDTIFNPKYPLKFEGTNGGREVFSSCANVSEIKVPIYAKNTRLTYTFNGAIRLKTIYLLSVDTATTVYTNCFKSCVALESITFEGSISGSVSFADSNLLTAESVQSIIDHLADRTGTSALTLTFHADVGAKLTDAQKATITVKNWTLVY